MTVTGSREALRECPFCGRSPFHAYSSGIFCTTEGCPINGVHCMEVDDWNTRATSNPERTQREALQDFVIAYGSQESSTKALDDAHAKAKAVLALSIPTLSPDPAGVTLTVEEIAREIEAHIDLNTFVTNEDGSVEVDRSGVALTLAPAILSLIQSKMVQPRIVTLPATSGTAAPVCELGGRAVIENNAVVIRFPLDAMQGALDGAWGMHIFDKRQKITDLIEFAEEFCNELNGESENGTTLIHRMADKAFLNMMEQGAFGFEVHEEQEL